MRYSQLVSAVCVCVGIVGCGPSGAGSFGGNYAIPDSNFWNVCIGQYVHGTDEGGVAVKKPLYAILWKIENGMGDRSSEYNYWITSINGHSIRVSKSKEAVYALQQDYSLKEIPLTEAERQQVFSMLTADDGADAPDIANVPLWKEKIDPHLHEFKPELPEDGTSNQ